MTFGISLKQLNFRSLGVLAASAMKEKSGYAGGYI